MRAAWRAILCVTFVLASLSSRTGQAQQGPPAPDREVSFAYAQRLAALESEVAALKAGAVQGSGCRCDAMAACGSRCQTACPCGSSGLYAGFSVMFAKPHFKEAFQATIVDQTGTLTMVPFSYDYDVSPRVWLGYLSESGLGVQTRYWGYDQTGDRFQSNRFTAAGTQAVTVVFPGVIQATPSDQVLTVDNGLEVEVVDLMGTLRLQLGETTITPGGGVAYVKMLQTFDANVANADTGSVLQQLVWQRDFEGVGPAAMLDMRRPLGCTGLAVVGGFRGYLLFGNKDLDRAELNGIGGGPPFLTMDKADEVLGIGEIELGLEWSRQFQCGSSLFVRGTYEGQLWSDIGAPTLGYLGFQVFNVSVGLAR